jgi:hypothetical protein
MRIVYCVYDKSLRGGSYFRHLPPDLAGVAQTAYDTLISASPEGGDPIRWPELLGGFVRLDSDWSCVYRFVEGRDLSPRPRPLNVILMALVPSDQIRGRDWRMVLKGTPFREMARQAVEADGSLPMECAEEVSLPELAIPQSMVADLLNPAAVKGDENRICAAVTQWDGPGVAHVVLSERGGRRTVTCQRTATLDIPSKSRDRSERTAGDTVRLSSQPSVGASDAVSFWPLAAAPCWSPYLRAIARYLMVCVPIVGLVSGVAWWFGVPRVEAVVKRTYRIKEAQEGREYELIEIQPGDGPGFILDHREIECLVFKSQFGEERRVPKRLIVSTRPLQSRKAKRAPVDEVSPEIQAGDGTQGLSE